MCHDRFIISEPIYVTVQGSKLPNITIVDLPGGYFREHPHFYENQNNMEDICKKYGDSLTQIFRGYWQYLTPCSIS